MATHKTLSLQHHLKSLSEAKLPGESSKGRRCVLECFKAEIRHELFCWDGFWGMFFSSRCEFKVATATTF